MHRAGDRIDDRTEMAVVFAAGLQCLFKEVAANLLNTDIVTMSAVKHHSCSKAVRTTINASLQVRASYYSCGRTVHGSVFWECVEVMNRLAVK